LSGRKNVIHCIMFCLHYVSTCRSFRLIHDSLFSYVTRYINIFATCTLDQMQTICGSICFVFTWIVSFIEISTSIRSEVELRRTYSTVRLKFAQWCLSIFWVALLHASLLFIYVQLGYCLYNDVNIAGRLRVISPSIVVFILNYSHLFVILKLLLITIVHTSFPAK